ncbi:MAG: DUF362 domain-containing protein [Thermoflexales bacterium]|nr:DUF362 domain-containing protein [Thermoflexales bacterium]
MKTNHARPKRISRRDFLKLAAAGATGMVSACAPKPADEGASTRVAPTIAPVPTATSPARVAIAQAGSYDRGLVRQQVQAMLDGLGGLGDVVRPGARVAIKINLTGGSGQAPIGGLPHVESYFTHPELVRALGELLRDAGAGEISIVEAVYGKVFQESGFEAIAKTIDARLVDLNRTAPYRDFATAPVGDNWLIYPDFIFNHILQEIDVFISVSKMKCHWWCGVTHSMKNLVGLVPQAKYQARPEDSYRTALHGPEDQTPARLPRVIVDLNRARPIHLALIDGIKTVEAGEGPWIVGVAPVSPGVLLASKSALAADVVATAVMGFDPEAAPLTSPFLRGHNHLSLAGEAGLGPHRLADIHIVGASVDDVRCPFRPCDGRNLA